MMLHVSLFTAAADRPEGGHGELASYLLAPRLLMDESSAVGTAGSRPHAGKMPAVPVRHPGESTWMTRLAIMSRVLAA
jgi:hypothetical protein